MNLSEAIAIRIREILKQKKISQYKLRLNTGVSKTTLTSILNCKYKSINLKSLFLIIRALNLSISEFFSSSLFSKDNLEEE